MHKGFKKWLQLIWSDVFPAIFRNTITPTSLLIGALVLVLLNIHQKGDALFLLSTIALNSLIAIFQEVKAKIALKKLELINSFQARKVTNHGIHLIDLEDIKEGDFLRLEFGDQVVADGVITATDSCEIDESLLTGESTAIDKNIQDQVYAGSLVVSGNATMRVTAAGEQTKVAQMATKLKWYDQKLTPLQQSVFSLIRWLTYLAIFMIIVIYLDGKDSVFGFIETINTIVSGALSLVPEGLLLASTLLFSYGALKMAKKRVLVQHLTAIEGFGRLNILCVDKTGTLTEGLPQVKEIIPLGFFRAKEVNHYLNVFAQTESSPNPTMVAIKKSLTPEDIKVAHKLVGRVAFSSERKWSAVSFIEKEIGRVSLALGAPDILAKHAHFSESVHLQIDDLNKHGFRVLVLIAFDAHDDKLIETVTTRIGKPVALLVFSNKLRESVVDTIFYLQAQGVKMKVISGDSASTVCQIARQAGILDADHVLTGDQLALLDERAWRDLVPKTTVFARVLPEQKELLIKTFQRSGFVGMVGDGVNDALALKKADLSVAMAEGSPAARQVADIVLLGNSFDAFPDGMKLGSQIILSLEMVTCLFVNKIIFSLVILLSSMTLNLPYPFQARHLLLLNIFIIGIPTLLWSLIPPTTTHRLNANKFFSRIFHFSLFNGLITGFFVTLSYIIALNLGPDNIEAARTVAVLITFALGIFSFWLIPKFMQATDNNILRAWQYVYMVFSLVCLSAFFTQFWFLKMFRLSLPNYPELLIFISSTLVAAYLQTRLLKQKKPSPLIANIATQMQNRMG